MYNISGFEIEGSRFSQSCDSASSSSMFPSLKILQISHVYYATHDSLSTLLTASPLFQDLTIKLNYSDLVDLDNNAGKFNILVLVPTLKRLVLECGFDIQTPHNYKHPGSRVP